jgi:nitrite reductase/ring-hydroxylating ferredoxin subunit
VRTLTPSTGCARQMEPERRPRGVVVARTAEIPPGGRKLVEIGGRSIGIFNLHGEYFALRNRCPHQGGPLCSGYRFSALSAATPGEYERERDGEIIRCPWHGWEFEIRSGRSWFDPEHRRVRSYRVRVEEAVQDVEATVETYSVSVSGDYIVVELGS